MIKLPFSKSIAKKPIYDQVILFSETLLPNEKIIVSREDFIKIVKCKNEYGHHIGHWDRGYNVSGFKLEKEIINNFFRVELGETKTNRNFELKNV